MRTFKQLQDEVLDWGADGDTEGLPRDLAKTALNRAQQRLLNNQQWDFMLWPVIEQIDVTSGNKNYALHPLFGQGLFFYNPITDEYLEEVPQGQLKEAKENFNRPTTGEPNRFSLTGLTKVRYQPAVAGVVSVVSSATESAANSLVVRGMRNGDMVSETLSSGTNWTSLTGSQTFDQVLSVVKIGSDWGTDIDISVGSTTVLTLLADEFGRQYRQFELIKEPSSAATVLYRFFQRVERMVYDNDVPQMPEDFDELLVLDVLKKLQGFTRATPDEVRMWDEQYTELMKDMNQTYRDGRTINARPRYVELVDRL